MEFKAKRTPRSIAKFEILSLCRPESYRLNHEDAAAFARTVGRHAPTGLDNLTVSELESLAALGRALENQYVTVNPYTYEAV